MESVTHWGRAVALPHGTAHGHATQVIDYLLCAAPWWSDPWNKTLTKDEQLAPLEGKSSAEGENTFMSSTVCSSTEDPLRLRTKVTDGAVAFRTTSISVVTMYNIDGTAFNPVEVLTVKVEWHWLLASPQQWRRCCCCCSAVTTTPICA